jgi:hypothetical protein
LQLNAKDKFSWRIIDFNKRLQLLTYFFFNWFEHFIGSKVLQINKHEHEWKTKYIHVVFFFLFYSLYYTAPTTYKNTFAWTLPILELDNSICSDIYCRQCKLKYTFHGKIKLYFILKKRWYILWYRIRYRSKKNRGIEYRYSIPVWFFPVLNSGIEYRSDFSRYWILVLSTALLFSRYWIPVLNTALIFPGICGIQYRYCNTGIGPWEKGKVIGCWNYPIIDQHWKCRLCQRRSITF